MKRAKFIAAMLMVALCLSCVAGAGATEAMAVAYGQRADHAFTQSHRADVYRIENGTDTAAFYNAEVKNENMEQTYHFKFVAAYMNDNNEVLVSAEVSRDTTEVVSIRLEPGEACFLQISAGGEAECSYQLTVHEEADEAGETIAAATPIAYGQRHDMRITGHGDVDMFAITNDTDTAAFYNATVKNVDMKNDYHNRFTVAYLSDNNEELSGREIAMDETGRICQRLEPGETCYLKITASGKHRSSYQVTVEEAPDEAGETIATAVPVAYGQRHDFGITGFGDVDMFVITNDTDSPAFYNASVKNVDLAVDYHHRFTVRYLNDNNEALSSIEIGTEKTGTLSQRLEPGETCYLEVTSTGSNICAYQLTVEEAADEAGETIATAAVIPYGARQDLRITGFGDVDMFTLTNGLDAPAFYVVTLKNVDMETDYHNRFTMAILNDNNESIYDAEIGLEKTLSMSVKLEPGETCYLKVTATGNNISAYQLTVDEAIDDVGDTRDDALAATLGERMNLRFEGYGDVDVLSVINAHDVQAFYRADIKNEDIAALRVSLFLAADEAAGDTKVDKEKTGWLAFALKPGETAYLEAKNAGDSTLGGYQITLTETLDDVGDTPDDAAPLAMAEPLAAAMSGWADVDCFRIAGPAADATCTIELTNGSIATDGGQRLVCTVRDAAENEVAYASLATEAILSFEAGAGKDYFVFVEMNRDGRQESGEYALRACMDPDHFAQDEWVTVGEPTCTEAGLREKTCALCGAAVLSETLEPTGHTPGETVREVEATCAQEGMDVVRCTVCGEALEETVVAMLPHTFGEWVVTREATKNEEGQETRTCAECGAEEYQPIEMLPKNFFEKLFGG